MSQGERQERDTPRNRCALCGQAIGRKNYRMLCQACAGEEGARERRLWVYGDVSSALHAAQQSISALLRDYPNAAPLVAQAREALAATLPVFDAAREEIRQAERTAAARIDAARALWRVQTGGNSWHLTGDGVSANTYVSRQAARTRRRLASERGGRQE